MAEPIVNKIINKLISCGKRQDKTLGVKSILINSKLNLKIEYKIKYKALIKKLLLKLTLFFFKK